MSKSSEMLSIIVISKVTSNERYYEIVKFLQNYKADINIYIYIYISYYNFDLFFQDIHLSKRSKY